MWGGKERGGCCPVVESLDCLWGVGGVWWGVGWGVGGRGFGTFGLGTAADAGAVGSEALNAFRERVGHQEKSGPRCTEERQLRKKNFNWVI